MATKTVMLTQREIELVKNLLYRHAEEFDRPHDPGSRDFTRGAYEKVRDADTIITVSPDDCACSDT